MNTSKIKSYEFMGGKYIYYPDYNQLINKETKEIFLKLKESKSIKTKYHEFTEESIKRKMIEGLALITFEVTQQCNLRCKYCIYSGDYHLERINTSKKMDIETAKKGIDIIYELVKNRDTGKDFGFSFYGGEPLLNFNLIKVIISYVESKFGKDWNLLYSMTTNLTYITDDMIKYFVEKDMDILVSLDGPKESHDAKRVFENEKGSFEIIINNFKRIKQYNEVFFDNNISINAVYSMDLSFKKLYNFFKNDKFIGKKIGTLNFVNYLNTDYYKKYKWDIEKFSEDKKFINSEILKSRRSKQELHSVEKQIESNYDLKIQMDETMFSSIAGTCEFDMKIYLDVHGNFHVCEKINNSIPIGSSDDGLNYKKMVEILEKFRDLNIEHCSKCDARFVCSRCFINFFGDKEIEINEHFCEENKKKFLETIESFIIFKEQETETV